MEQTNKVTVRARVNAPVAKTWEIWNTPEHIMKWNTASDDWHTTKSENDLRAGGTFSARMEAKDGSFGFDFGGQYDEVVPHQRIAYTLGDGRKVSIDFTDHGDSTEVVETFDAENENPVDMQRAGWQAIMDNFRQYCEANK